MSAITAHVPDDLAARLQKYQQRLPEILELGLRELSAKTQVEFEGASEVLQFLTGLPTPEEILVLRPSEALRERVAELLEKNHAGGLSSEEEQDWERYEFLEHLVRIAKAKAALKLHG